jgi:hypothetical protein
VRASTRLVLTALLVPASILLASCQEGNVAKSRVKCVLEGMKVEGAAGGGGSMQMAIGQWAKGVEAIINPNEELQAENGFKAWAEQKKLYRKISAYEVLDTQSDGETQVVSVTIEGDPYAIRVRPRQPMTWAW